ncbi:MAG: hypothetical protein QGH60_15445 [Phycisphaerae bacterium]|nr:hypothetical protein [Phycisphaerae bacterium]
MRILLSFLLLSALTATRAVSETLPGDRRLESHKKLTEQSHLPFLPSKTAAGWKKRAAFLRLQAKVGLGLWPMPTAPALNAVVHGRVERDDYTVEKVYFESLPGHFVTGNLYRPKSGNGKPGPAVLCPYGHWPGGRFNSASRGNLAAQRKKGQERYDPSGRYPLQARCAHLARMGCVVFMYDMVGYADSVQIPHKTAGNPRQLTNIAGLQTWNSMRAMDFLGGLDDVNPKRIAVTGASGGGMQTLLLFAVDPRPAVSVPVVSVFVSRKGAPCTYGPYMRIDEGTIALAALAAPRPLCVINAGGDWTSKFMTHGYPQLKEHYRMLDIEERFAGRLFAKNPHNYNILSREYMYAFVKKHLKLDSSAPVAERDFKPLTKKEMTVWDDKHPRPSGKQVGKDHQQAVTNWFVKDAAKQLDAMIPSDRASLDRYRKVAGGALSVAIGRQSPDPAKLRFRTVSKKQLKRVLNTTGLLSNADAGSQLPFVLLEPVKGNNQTALWVHPEGKASLFKDGQIRPCIRRLLDAGFTVAGVDLLGQGDFLKDGKPVKTTPLIEGESLNYTLGNRRPLFSDRVFDVMTSVSFLRNHSRGKSKVFVLGLRGAGHWVAAACGRAGDDIAGVAIDTAGFRFAGLKDAQHVDFLPGAAKYHDLPGMMALCAPHKMWLAGEKNIPDILRRTYAAARGKKSITLFEGKQPGLPAAAATWVVSEGAK